MFILAFQVQFLVVLIFVFYQKPEIIPSSGENLGKSLVIFIVFYFSLQAASRLLDFTRTLTFPVKKLFKTLSLIKWQLRFRVLKKPNK